MTNVVAWSSIFLLLESLISYQYLLGSYKNGGGIYGFWMGFRQHSYNPPIEESLALFFSYFVSLEISVRLYCHQKTQRDHRLLIGRVHCQTMEFRQFSSVYSPFQILICLRAIPGIYLQKIAERLLPYPWHALEEEKWKRRGPVSRLPC